MSPFAGIIQIKFNRIISERQPPATISPFRSRPIETMGARLSNTGHHAGQFTSIP